MNKGILIKVSLIFAVIFFLSSTGFQTAKGYPDSEEGGMGKIFEEEIMESLPPIPDLQKLPFQNKKAPLTRQDAGEREKSEEEKNFEDDEEETKIQNDEKKPVDTPAKKEPEVEKTENKEEKNPHDPNNWEDPTKAGKETGVKHVPTDKGGGNLENQNLPVVPVSVKTSQNNDFPPKKDITKGEVRNAQSNSSSKTSKIDPVQEARNALAQAADEAFGKNYTQGTNKNVGCGSTTCEIMNKGGQKMGNLPLSSDVNNKIANSGKYELVQSGKNIDPKNVLPGDIVSTPSKFVTSTSVNKKGKVVESTNKVTGHIGVVNSKGLVANNSSKTGRVKNSTVTNWNSSVSSRRGLVTNVWRLVKP